VLLLLARLAAPGKRETAFRHALELSEKDGSIVLFAGSMFVTAEVMTAWDKFTQESKLVIGLYRFLEIRSPILKYRVTDFYK